MMKAGKSAAEIMEVMGLPLLTMEEIKQRLLDDIMRAEPPSHVDENPEPSNE